MPSVTRLSRSVGVRSRVGAIFVAGVAVLVLGVGLATWALSSRYLFELREAGGMRQVRASAAAVQQLLAPGDARDLAGQVRSLSEVNESGVLVLRRDTTLASAGLSAAQVPQRLRDLVDSGRTGRQRVRVDGATHLLIGVPLTSGVGYYQLLPLRELSRTLGLLRIVLVVAGTIAVLLSALLARLAVRGALRPIDELTRAAQAVARGELSTRMPETDRDLAEVAEVFNATIADLERRVQADARFAGNVSHELRSPLTTMINAMAVLQRRRNQLPEPAQEAVSLLETEVDRFHHLVLDLLDVAALTEGHRTAVPQAVPLAELVRRLASVDGWGPVLISDAATVQADPRLLERVVCNLVKNAQTHGRGLVGVNVLRRGDASRLEVDDAGPGVPARSRQQIFERFARGEAAVQQHEPGVGLGLALVEEITHLHGGRTWVEDRPDGGARFVVELPNGGP